MDYGMDRWEGQIAEHLDLIDEVVIWHWSEPTGEPDPVHGAVASVERQLEVQVFLHEVGATSSVRQFAEIVAGDLIMDYPGEHRLEGRSGFWVERNGVKYMPKRVSGRLAEIWDASYKSSPLLKTVVLERAK